MAVREKGVAEAVGLFVFKARLKPVAAVVAGVPDGRECGEVNWEYFRFMENILKKRKYAPTQRKASGRCSST